LELVCGVNLRLATWVSLVAQQDAFVLGEHCFLYGTYPKQMNKKSSCVTGNISITLHFYSVFEVPDDKTMVRAHAGFSVT
jgi:hypothetical protein